MWKSKLFGNCYRHGVLVKRTESSNELKPHLPVPFPWRLYTHGFHIYFWEMSWLIWCILYSIKCVDLQLHVSVYSRETVSQLKNTTYEWFTYLLMVGETISCKLQPFIRLTCTCTEPFFCIYFFGLRWRFPPLPWDFTVLHNDPAAHQDHCCRCRIRIRDHCPRSLARYQWVTTSTTNEPPHLLYWTVHHGIQSVGAEDTWEGDGGGD